MHRQSFVLNQAGLGGGAQSFVLLYLPGPERKEGLCLARVPMQGRCNL
jgi:hypothetical protein